MAEKIFLGDVARASCFGFLFGQVLAPGDDIHAEGLTDRRRALSKLAEAKDAEREPFKVRSDGRLPRRTGFQPSILETDTAGEFQHQAKGDAGRRAANRTGPANRDPALGAGLDVE